MRSRLEERPYTWRDFWVRRARERRLLSARSCGDAVVIFLRSKRCSCGARLRPDEVACRLVEGDRI